jgi:hypothetical protein
VSKVSVICLLLVLSLVPAGGLTAAAGSSGEVNLSSGVPDKTLRYEDFRITDDGYITGTIVNASDKPRTGVRIDMWTTNRTETRILWRKALNIGDLAPRARYQVKEAYKDDVEEPSRTKFMFRLPSGSNFRN